MRSICLGKPFGIPLIATKLFNILLVLIFAATLVTNIYNGRSILEALVMAGGVLFLWIILFSIVTLHEYGHSLVAKSLGYNVPKILLHPLGGAALIEGDWCKSARDEFLITIAGPSVNLVLALITLPVMHLSPFLMFFFVINFILLVFNILPIYPMDGGRVVRAACTYWLKGNWWRATQIAWAIGIATAIIVMPLFWLYGSWFGAVVVGLVVFGLAPFEIRHLKIKWLAEEAEGVHELYRDSHPESYEWMSHMSEHIVMKAITNPDQFGLTGTERELVRQYTERCWSRLALDNFDEAHQAWFDRARDNPHSIASQTFIISLALPKNLS